MVFEVFLLSINTPVPLSNLAVRHAMRQSAVRHFDNVAHHVELALEEHGFDIGTPTLDLI